jgi:hypothetical protein
VYWADSTEAVCPRIAEIGRDSWIHLGVTAATAFLEAREKFPQPGFIEFDVFAAIDLISADLKLAAQFIEKIARSRTCPPRLIVFLKFHRVVYLPLGAEDHTPPHKENFSRLLRFSQALFGS